MSKEVLEEARAVIAEANTLLSEPQNSVPAYKFVQPKNAYITREEFWRLDSSIHPAERVPLTVAPNHLETEINGFANPSINILNAYSPSIWQTYHDDHELNHDSRSKQEQNGEMNERDYERLYGQDLDIATKAIGGYVSRFDHNEYLPLNNAKYDLDNSEQREYSVWSYHPTNFVSKYHSQYFCQKVDQGVLDQEIASDISAHDSFNEMPAFSFPYLVNTFNTQTPSTERERDYDFVKVIVSYKNFQRNPQSRFIEHDFVIRIFRITNAKTSCTEKFVHGDMDMAYEVAKRMYCKWSNKKGYSEIYDLQELNKVIKENIKPSDESIRFLPDGFYKDQAYVHDRETDKYVILGEYKKLTQKRLLTAQKLSKKKVADMFNSPEVVDAIRQKAIELGKDKSTKDTIDWLKSL